jgi:hypothetical protein
MTWIVAIDTFWIVPTVVLTKLTKLTMLTMLTSHYHRQWPSRLLLLTWGGTIGT